MRTRVIQSDVFEKHFVGASHPESPQRISAIAELLHRAPIENLELVAPKAVSTEALLRVHAKRHVDAMLNLRGQCATLDEDTALGVHSVDVALLAAGAAVQLVDDVMSQSASNGFALVRPPGHHAEYDRAMGFCVFNSVAVAAEAALARGAQRVAIVDFDVHHGNGTQQAFSSRRDVLFISTHQFPFYPGTGAAHETGEGAGHGFTLNVPMPPRMGDAEYGAVFESLVLPKLEAFRPDFLLLSAGFDAHRADPIGGMSVTERGFAAMCSALASFAQTHCDGKLVAVLEGGYHHAALSQSVHAALEVFSQARRETFPQGASAAVNAVIDNVKSFSA
jgi:acetoin utilization deacetylase AcuC-like enzyme